MSRHNCREPESRDQWGVMQCDCGMLRVKLGTVVLELEPNEVLRLIDLLDRAADHFALGGTPGVQNRHPH